MEKLKTGAAGLGINLSAAQLSQFQLYYEELIDWNTRFNLTAITEYQSVQLNHFLDSLTLALVWQPSAGSRVLDVGAGAGMPGIPLKITFPQIKLTLLEATGKKVGFLRHVVDKLALRDVEIISGRAEDVAHQPAHRANYNIVLARALAAMPALAELTLPFCVNGGLVVAYKKGAIEQEISAAGRAIQLCGGRLKVVQPVNLPEFTDNRFLVVLDKIAPTPIVYPRRPGLPAKSPLI